MTDLIVYIECVAYVQVGIGIGGDCAKVFRDYNVSVKSVEDLSYLANQKLDGKPKTWGLQALAKILVCKEVSITFHWMPTEYSLSNIFSNVFLNDYVCLTILSNHWTLPGPSTVLKFWERKLMPILCFGCVGSAYYSDKSKLVFRGQQIQILCISSRNFCCLLHKGKKI